MLRTGIVVRRSAERGRTRTDWLDSLHSFSFAAYQDPRHLGLGPLRVLNDDRVAPGAGFSTHPHRDMDIVSYVLEGAMVHEDSEGHVHTIGAGETQFLRAGTGVEHSEMNASQAEPVHFLQVWFVPRTPGLKPAYDQRAVVFPERGGWATLASPGMGGFDLDADVVMLTARAAAGQRLGHVVHAGRQAYVFVVAGEVQLGGEQLREGDAALVKDGVVGLKATQPSHVLLFDLPL
jgi:hypothetical protein